MSVRIIVFGLIMYLYKINIIDHTVYFNSDISKAIKFNSFDEINKLKIFSKYEIIHVKR